MSKVVRFHQTGGPEVLQIENVDVAAPKAGEVQIDVAAIGINRAEVMYRMGEYTIQPQFPAGLGYEASGVVAALGEGVDGMSVGDPVSVVPAFLLTDYGMYGERVNVPAHAVVKHPATLSFEEAAATWMMFVTAYGALIELGQLKAGEVVLINAASSSVGLAAIQVANMIGAIPVALTRSDRKRDALLAAGAKHVIAGSGADLPEQVKALNGGELARIAFDPVGGPGAANLVRSLGAYGIFFQYGALDTRDLAVPVGELLGRHLAVRGYQLFEITLDPQKLERAKRFIVEGLASGTLKPAIDRVFEFSQIVDAHRYMEAGEQVGKIVVKV